MVARTAGGARSRPPAVRRDRINVPKRVTPDVVETPPVRRRETCESGERRALPGNPRTCRQLLVVEGDLPIRTLAREALGDTGCRGVAVATHAAALALLRAAHSTLILAEPAIP